METCVTRMYVLLYVLSHFRPPKEPPRQVECSVLAKVTSIRSIVRLCNDLSLEVTPGDDHLVATVPETASVLPILLCREEFLKLHVCCIPFNQSPNQARGSCPRPGNGYLVIRWSAYGTQGTCTPWLPHHLNLSDGNPTKWICHVSPTRSIFPFNVVGLEDFRPPSLSPIQSWLCLKESVGAVVCHQCCVDCLKLAKRG